MSFQLTKWLQILQSAFTSTAQLLAPQAVSCLLCGKLHNEARSAEGFNRSKLTLRLQQSVCGVCLSTIPWLTRIVCHRCGRGIHCDDCLRTPQRSFILNRSAVYYNPAMRALLAQYKYRGNEELAPLLADMLVPAFERMTAELAARITPSGPAQHKQSHKNIALYWDAITFVPISPERALDRGFNQAEQLANDLAQRYRIPLMQLLIRERHTEKQSFKTRSERMRDTRQLFNINTVEFDKLRNIKLTLRNKEKSTNRVLRVLIIDDIYTTGSTGEACSQALSLYSGQPLEIYILTWARS